MTNLVEYESERGYISGVRLCKLPLTERSVCGLYLCEIKRITRVHRGVRDEGGEELLDRICEKSDIKIYMYVRI